jgi:tetratricopeptide (TPR) repeat protein
MRLTLSIVFACCLALGWGCGGSGGGGGGPADTAASLTDEGWTHFEAEEYQQALDKFHQALGLDDTYADAYNGLGWSHAKMDSLAQAIAGFDEALTLGVTSADPHAGKAPVYRDYEAETDHFSLAVSSADSALAISSDYIFSHDEDFDWRDLRLVLAQSYYGLGDFASAADEVTALGGDAPEPSSPTYVEDLAAEIEELEALYGG